MNKLKKVLTFKDENEERDFRAISDSTEFINWKKSEKVVFPKLKPSTTTISQRLSEFVLNEMKMIANKRDAFIKLI